MGEASEEALAAGIKSMTTLNKRASEISKNYEVHACTDVTGFSFLGHLHEMLDGKLSADIYSDNVPVIPGAAAYADEFLLTAAGQRNRNNVGSNVKFHNISFAMEEVLFDPQTSGGLLMAVTSENAGAMLKEMQSENIPAVMVGVLKEKEEYEINVF